MLQNTRTRLVAPGLGSPTRVEALVLEPATRLPGVPGLPGDVDRLVSAVLGADGADAADAAPTWVPAVDVEEGDDAVRLAVEVPGVDPNALDVTVDDRVLTVSGERPLARADRGRTAYRLERRYGRFARRIALPKTVDPDRIRAHYEHGVLFLEVPKRPEAQLRRIAITTAAQRTDDPRRLDGPPAER
jgi:HSP20 family protein